jgi:hypothetical protein
MAGGRNRPRGGGMMGGRSAVRRRAGRANATVASASSATSAATHRNDDRYGTQSVNVGDVHTSVREHVLPVQVDVGR